jgi:endonuclease I
MEAIVMKRNKSFLSLFSAAVALGLSSFVFMTSLQATGDGSWLSPYSVSQAISNQNNSLKTVEGYVVGQPIATNTVITKDYPNDFAVALAENNTETNTQNMVYVQIPSSFRQEFGLMTNPSLKGTAIKVTGHLTSYFAHAGLKETTQMVKSSASDPDVPEEPADPPVYDESYYDLARGKTGDALKAALHQIIDDHTELSYSEVWDALKVTDEDPNNSSHVILLYTGRSQAKTTNGSDKNDWNREHVWAKSHGDFGTTMGPGTDIHHLRPTDASVNSSRGNLDFDNGGTEHTEAIGNYYDNDSWEPRDSVKGDVARMLFYMAVRYEGDSGEPQLEINDNVSNGSSPYHGKRSTLLQWHQEDPVDDQERRRNNIIFEDYQHNRNPFIDHPEWVEEIW